MNELQLSVVPRPCHTQPMNPWRHIGEVLRSIRGQRDAAELAVTSGVHYNTVLKIEKTGEGTWGKILQLLLTLGVTEEKIYRSLFEAAPERHTSVANDESAVYTGDSPAKWQERTTTMDKALQELIRRWEDLPREARNELLNHARLMDAAHATALAKGRHRQTSSAGTRQKRGPR